MSQASKLKCLWQAFQRARRRRAAVDRWVAQEVRRVADGRIGSGSLAAAELGTIDTLTKLRSLIDELPENRFAQRVFEGAVVIASCGVVAWCLFSHVDGLPIMLEAETTALSFVLREDARLLDLQSVASVTIDPVRRAEGPSGAFLATEDGQGALSVRASQPDVGASPPPEISVSGVRLRAGSTVEVRREAPRRISLTVVAPEDHALAGDEGDVAVGVQGRVQLAYRDEASAKLDTVQHDLPARIGVIAAGRTLHMHLHLRSDDFALRRLLPVASIQFPSDDDESSASNVSAIRSARISFADVEGADGLVAEGEALRVGLSRDAPRFVLRSVTLGERGLHVVASGLAQMVHKGSEANEVNLAPTRLQWMKSRSSLAVAWSVLVAIVSGVLWTVKRLRA